MAVLKVIEVLANSEKGFDDAVATAIEKASNSVKNIRSAYIHEQSVTVTDGKIDNYRVNVKISFEVS